MYLKYILCIRKLPKTLIRFNLKFESSLFNMDCMFCDEDFNIQDIFYIYPILPEAQQTRKLSKFGNFMAPLALAANLTTRWRHLH